MEGFQEIPGHVTLLLNITNCENNCPGCHSPHLKSDTGEVLSMSILRRELARGPFDCVCFMGEGNDKKALADMIEKIHFMGLSSAVYCGRDISPKEWIDEYGVHPSYLKVGSYKEECGPLNKQTTNQRLYKIEDVCVDITHRFWRKKND